MIVGDANRSEFATALKIGSTALVAQLLESGWDPDLALQAPVHTLKEISSNPAGPWSVVLADGRSMSALDIQRIYRDAADRAFRGRDSDTDWTLDAWAECLDGLEGDPTALVGKVDWVTKLEQLRRFAADSPEGWADPDLVKVDLAYHHIDPR